MAKAWFTLMAVRTPNRELFPRRVRVLGISGTQRDAEVTLDDHALLVKHPIHGGIAWIEERDASDASKSVRDWTAPLSPPPEAAPLLE